MKPKAWCGLVTLIALLAACGERTEPVGQLTVEPTALELPYPGFAGLRLSWRMERPLGEVEGRPLVFVHLLDAPGSVLRTFDHPLRFDWRPGRTEAYEIFLYQSALAPPLEPGSYTLSVGLYDVAGRRWPLEVAGEELDRFEYGAAEVTVAAEGDDLPMFYFSPAWLPVEAGTDRQIVRRRWLAGEGTLRIAEIGRPGEAWMLLRIPGADDSGIELVLQEGTEVPAALISSSCGGSEVSVSGTGAHEVVLPLAAGGEGPPTECELQFRPNFHLLELDTLARRSLSLEVLAWRPAGAG